MVEKRGVTVRVPECYGGSVIERPAAEPGKVVVKLTTPIKVNGEFTHFLQVKKKPRAGDLKESQKGGDNEYEVTLRLAASMAGITYEEGLEIDIDDMLDDESEFGALLANLSKASRVIGKLSSGG